MKGPTRAQCRHPSAANQPGTAGPASVRDHEVRLRECQQCSTLFRASSAHEIYCATCQDELRSEKGAEGDLTGWDNSSDLDV